MDTAEIKVNYKMLETDATYHLKRKSNQGSWQEENKKLE